MRWLYRWTLVMQTKMIYSLRTTLMMRTGMHLSARVQ